MPQLLEFSLFSLTAGGAYALIAFGLVAVHRRTGVVNFAQGAIGTASTCAVRFAGTPERIADEVERYAEAGVDGFNVFPVATLGRWDEFVDEAVSVLQRCRCYSGAG
ncbi:MAG: hypothetical protein ACRYHA_34335 [Janthinobacterium lividum]